MTPFLNRFRRGVILIFFLLAASSLKAALEAEEGRHPAHLLRLITESLDWRDDDPNTVALKEKVIGLQHWLSDDTLQHLMTLGSQYMVSITLPGRKGEPPLKPQINELFAILDCWVQMEIALPDHSPYVSSFAYRMLQQYAPRVSLENQLFCLTLVCNLLADTHFDQTVGEEIVNWAFLFMRESHTPSDCTQIAHLVRDYILAHPDDDLNLSGLQVAVQEEPTWLDDEVISKLSGYIGMDWERGRVDVRGKRQRLSLS